MNKKIFLAAVAAIYVAALIYKRCKKKDSSDDSIPDCCFDCEDCSMLHADD